jgi:acyl-CoA reductase-like NAD-dependent aldehyde dehydrogenase
MGSEYSATYYFYSSRRAISFVGGDAAGRHIYHRGSTNGKRVQCNMGAKNHGVIMPDANKVRSSVPDPRRIRNLVSDP